MFTNPRNPLRALAVLATLVTASVAHSATSIVNDSVFGTGTVLRDTTNNQEYLRLDLTMGYGYGGVSAELGAGGVFDSWSIATVADMEALGASAGAVHGSTDTGVIAIVEGLRDFFCPAGTCVNFSSTHTYARGLVADPYSLPDTYEAFSMGRRLNVVPNEADYRVSGYGFTGDTTEEVWLTRAVSPVPIPAASLLLIGGLGTLAGLRRRKPRG